MPTEYTPSVNQDTQFQVIDRRKRGYFTVDNIVIDEYGEQLGPHGLAVYMALCRFANADQECWPSHATVAKRTGMSRRQVGREIAKLAGLSLILVTPQYDTESQVHRSNLYTLLEVEGIDSVTTPHIDSVTNPIVRQSNRTKHIKKDPRLNSKKELSAADRRRAYVPDEYADIIIH